MFRFKPYKGVYLNGIEIYVNPNSKYSFKPYKGVYLNACR